MALNGGFLVITHQAFIPLPQPSFLLYPSSLRSLISLPNARRGAQKSPHSRIMEVGKMHKLIAIKLSVMLGIGSIAYADQYQAENVELVEVDKGEFSDTWVNPSVDLSKYDKIVIEAGELEFRDVTSIFSIDEKDQIRATDLISNAFVEQLSKNRHFDIVAETGPTYLF